MKVLVPTDGSEHSMKAVQRGLELAEKQEAQVTLMSVAYFGADYLDEMPPNIREKLEDEARAALKKAKALFDAKNLPVETVLMTGLVPANLIIQKAQDGKFDRIVIGSTGQNALEKIVMGSTAAKVVAHAPCEVTVVR
ncbi:MAG: universal stress protein [Deltaproteobacteria bacterium]|nr:universal stress protein [Deltaproteobacteria bacterium]